MRLMVRSGRGIHTLSVVFTVEQESQLLVGGNLPGGFESVATGLLGCKGPKHAARLVRSGGAARRAPGTRADLGGSRPSRGARPTHGQPDLKTLATPAPAY